MVGLLIYFPLLAFLRWIFDSRDQSVPARLHGKADKSNGNFIIVKYAVTPTIRRGLRTGTGSRAKHRKKAAVFGFSNDSGLGDGIEAGAGTSNPPSPRLPLPPLTIDEVLQKSVAGFRESWWPTSSAAAFEDARVEEAEGNFGGIGGRDMNPEAKVGPARVMRDYQHPVLPGPPTPPPLPRCPPSFCAGRAVLLQIHSKVLTFLISLP